MYKRDRELFNQTAKFWTDTYAVVREEGEGAQEETVQRVCSMGFTEQAVRKALADANWDETVAVNALLS